jgi:hypothetical protein
METIVNKVAESGILTVDLAKYLVPESDIASFDLKPFLFREMILREKDYREALKLQDWTIFEHKHVHIFCSTDAIIPMWANMLAVVHLQPIAKSVFFGTKDEMSQYLLMQNIAKMDTAEYTDKRVVIKGCGDINIPAQGYVAVSALLQPIVKSLMYGEPCSTVPVFKRKN